MLLPWMMKLIKKEKKSYGRYPKKKRRSSSDKRERVLCVRKRLLQ